MIRWLRKTMGNTALAAWILDHQGRGLSPRQLRYWELILDLPGSQVNQWVETQQTLLRQLGPKCTLLIFI